MKYNEPSAGILKRIEDLEAQRDALLEALEEVTNELAMFEDSQGYNSGIVEKGMAAINKVRNG